MPKSLHEALKKQADKKNLKGERRAAYIYGALNKWKKKQHNK